MLSSKTPHRISLCSMENASFKISRSPRPSTVARGSASPGLTAVVDRYEERRLPVWSIVGQMRFDRNSSYIAVIIRQGANTPLLDVVSWRTRKMSKTSADVAHCLCRAARVKHDFRQWGWRSYTGNLTVSANVQLRNAFHTGCFISLRNRTTGGTAGGCTGFFNSLSPAS